MFVVLSDDVIARVPPVCPCSPSRASFQSSSCLDSHHNLFSSLTPSRLVRLSPVSSSFVSPLPSSQPARRGRIIRQSLSMGIPTSIVALRDARCNGFSCLSQASQMGIILCAILAVSATVVTYWYAFIRERRRAKLDANENRSVHELEVIVFDPRDDTDSESSQSSQSRQSFQSRQSSHSRPRSDTPQRGRTSSPEPRDVHGGNNRPPDPPPQPYHVGIEYDPLRMHRAMHSAHYVLPGAPVPSSAYHPRLVPPMFVPVSMSIPQAPPAPPDVSASRSSSHPDHPGPGQTQSRHGRYGRHLSLPPRDRATAISDDGSDRSGSPPPDRRHHCRSHRRARSQFVSSDRRRERLQGKQPERSQSVNCASSRPARQPIQPINSQRLVSSSIGSEAEAALYDLINGGGYRGESDEDGGADLYSPTESRTVHRRVNLPNALGIYDNEAESRVGRRQGDFSSPHQRPSGRGHRHNGTISESRIGGSRSTGSRALRGSHSVGRAPRVNDHGFGGRDQGGGGRRSVQATPRGRSSSRSSQGTARRVRSRAASETLSLTSVFSPGAETEASIRSPAASRYPTEAWPGLRSRSSGSEDSEHPALATRRGCGRRGSSSSTTSQVSSAGAVCSFNESGGSDSEQNVRGR